MPTHQSNIPFDKNCYVDPNKRKILKENRVGDHIWYISNMKKFKKQYPNWKQKYSTLKIIKELVEELS